MAHESNIQQPVYFTITTLLVTPERECLLFDDGHAEVQHPLFDFDPEGSLPHYACTKDQMRAWRAWLNSPEVVRVLEQQ